VPPASPARSLRSRLLWRVLLPLAATWSVGSATAFTLSWALAGRAFDRAMLDDAYAIAANVVLRDGALVLNLSPREVDSVLFDHEEKEYFLIRSSDGPTVASNADLMAWARDAGPELSDFADGVVAGASVRIARLRVQTPSPFLVVIGQTTLARQRLLRGLLLRSLAPQLLLMAALGFYLWRQISRELAPLGHLQRELERRDSGELEPIGVVSASADLERLRDAANALLARIKRSVQAQREFTGNVAHDLRTPLAGIRALAEYGLAREEPAIWRQQLESILQSGERANRLVDQLLALALADEAQESVHLEAVRIDELVRRILIGFVERADAAGVDLGAVGLDEPVTGRASPVLLEGVLTNLIDNALRYGRSAARATLTVEVATEARAIVVAVTDSGPGLSADQREGLARRWAKGPAGEGLDAGTGLGLAIASRYASLMGGSLELSDGAGGIGLRATLVLPR
jgi:two-component system sensor histidine kinase TctE